MHVRTFCLSLFGAATLALGLTASAGAAPAAGSAEMLEAVILDFQKNPYDGPQAPIAALYKKACDAGYGLACKYETWHHPSESHIAEAVEVMRPACDQGDSLACLVVAWRLETFSSNDSEAKIGTAPEAVALYQKACDAGLSRACTDLAWMYHEGEGMPDDDLDRARELREKACDAGEPRACDDLADMHLAGQGGAAVDKPRAAELRQKSCDGGLAAACDTLGDAYRSGQGVAVDFVKAAALYQKACDGWYSGGCNHLAQVYEEGEGVQKSKEKADELQYRACDMGRTASCLRLDAEVRAEMERTKDTSLEAKFIDRMCVPTRAAGCYTLGYAYDTQAHDDAGHARAAKVYERACALGDQDACLNLGVMLARGEGVAEDDARARVLYEAACKAGERTACANLARQHFQCGVPDAAQAMELFTSACRHGEFGACADLGRRYETGDIVTQDLAKARSLYTQGCDRFDGDSCVRLGRMIEAESPKEAAALYSKSCLEGSQMGCISEGEARVAGLSGKADAYLAADAWRRACEADGSRGTACVRLASLYFEGVGTRKGTSEGLNLLVDGCQRGSALACDRLWVGKHHGLYTGVDAARADSARKQACALRGETTCADAPVALTSANGLVSGKAPSIPGAVAKRGLTAGMCVLEVEVDASGKVTGSRVADCEPGLVSDSQKAVRGWKFASGQARNVDVRLVFQQGVATRIELVSVPESTPCTNPTGF